jgi:hypothetical protein
VEEGREREESIGKKEKVVESEQVGMRMKRACLLFSFFAL